MSGRSPPLYCTFTLFAMQGHQKNVKKKTETVVSCFSHSAYWLPTRIKLLYTVANPARGLLNGKKRSGSAPLPPRALLVRRKSNQITRRIYMPRRYAGLGPSHVRTRISLTRRIGQWVSLRRILRSRVR